MITIGSVTGKENMVQAGHFGMDMQDPVSKNIQNQIANAQKRQQEVSSNTDMPLEEKMKKRQEIQQEITSLNQQLRQHQVELRREQQHRQMSMDDMLGGNRGAAKSDNQGNGLSQACMQAVISADASIKQAKIQGSMATQMKGRAGVLESEIKTDRSKGTSTEKKEAELADIQAKAQQAAAAQVSILADAGKAMNEAGQADSKAETEGKRGKEVQKAGNQAQVTGDEAQAGSMGPETAAASATETAAVTIGSQETNAAAYKPVDIRL